MRRLIESMDKISEAGPKGLQRPGLELGPEMGGAGGGGISGGPSATAMARLPTLTQVVKPPPPAVWRSPKTGQTITAPGTTVSQPLPPGVTPSTAGAGRGTAPVTRPPLGKDAGAASAGPRDGAVKKDTGPVGSYRPGGERDTLGRREPGTGETRLPPGPPEGNTKKAAAISAAGHAAIAAGLYPWSKDKKSGSVAATTSPAAAGEQRFEVELYKPSDSELDSSKNPPSDTAEPTTIDLPRVGPQGPDSPFYVVPDKAPEAPEPAVAPAKPAPVPILITPAKPTSPAPVASKPTPAKPTTDVTGSGGTTSGTATGGTGFQKQNIEQNLRDLGIIKETFSQRLLNDFINFVESKNKSKAK